LKPGIHR